MGGGSGSATSVGVRRRAKWKRCTCKEWRRRGGGFRELGGYGYGERRAMRRLIEGSHIAGSTRTIVASLEAIKRGGDLGGDFGTRLRHSSRVLLWHGVWIGS